MSDAAKPKPEPTPGRARECAARISQEIKFLLKNVPVSGKNMDTHLVIAWELENAANAIKSRVNRRKTERGRGRTG